MPTITVLAPDSALAMDEVMRQLGADAFILSTQQKNGQVEIRATNDHLPMADKGANRVKFDDLLAAKTGIADTRVLNRPREPLARAAQQAQVHPNAEIQSDAQPVMSAAVGQSDLHGAQNVVQLQTPTRSRPQARSSEQAQTPHPQVPSQSAPAKPAIADAPALHSDVFQAIERLDGIVGELVKQLRDPAAPATTAATAIPHDLPRKVLTPQPERAMDTPAVLIVGPSGAGKTTLAAKMAGLIKDMRDISALTMVELTEEAPAIANPMRHLSRIVGAQAMHSPINALNPQFIPIETERFIFEAPANSKGAHDAYDALLERFYGDQITVILALPAGLSKSRIRAIAADYADLAPQVALVKLDESESSAEEIAWIFEAGLRIGWLSGTDMLKGTISPAQHDIIAEFLDQSTGQAAQ